MSDVTLGPFMYQESHVTHRTVLALGQNYKNSLYQHAHVFNDHISPVKMAGNYERHISTMAVS